MRLAACCCEVHFTTGDFTAALPWLVLGHILVVSSQVVMSRLDCVPAQPAQMMLRMTNGYGQHSSQHVAFACACTAQLVLREFLNPRQWKPSEDSRFFLDAEQINSLCEVAERVFKSEPSVLRLKGSCQTAWLRHVLQLDHAALPLLLTAASTAQHTGYNQQSLFGCC